MAIQVYTDYQSWKQAVHDRKLTTVTYSSVESGPSEDDMWEPTWAVESKNGFIFDDSPMYGCFQNVPMDELGTTYRSEGFLCDTEEEFAQEMLKDDERHDAMNEKDTCRPTLH